MENDIFSRKHYDFGVPRSLIAQEPVFPRDKSRLLTIGRGDSSLKEGRFTDILSFLKEGDVLVLNNTRVIKARLIAKRKENADLEILLTKKLEPGIWEVLVKPGKRAKIGDTIILERGGNLSAKILGRTSGGGRVLQFSSTDFESLLDTIGKPPLPPYIKKEIDDFSKYQTIFAKEEGAIAAPTAGLHFTRNLLNEIERKGVKIAYVTLHCGLATFRPVVDEDIRRHKIESEWIEVDSSAAEEVTRAKEEKRRVIAVGTTAIRTLETAAIADDRGGFYVKPFSGETSLYVFPGYEFKIIDGVITNFHTPYSTNLILISSFCGTTLLKRAYEYAVKQQFRFYSFGDATLII